MAKYKCNVSVAAVYAQASYQSEMITQLLYGENFEILEHEGDFYHIKSDFDGVEGFVSVLHAGQSEEVNNSILKNPYFWYHDAKGDFLLSGGSEGNFDSQSQNLNIIEVAEKFLNVPFLQGGRSFFGLDASALTQLVYKICGYKLPRFSAEQAGEGRVLDFIEEAQPGDLAFFENEEGEIVHVGILLSPAQIIHVYGKVRVDALDYSGIYNTDLNRHTHKLRFAKTFFN